MRDVTYRYLPSIGESSQPVTRSLADFVQDIPYFFAFDLVPPLSVMNEEFMTGEHDAGMSGGCIWEPFAIEGEEFQELVEELRIRGFRFVEPRPWVQTREDWHVWKFEFEVGIPAEEHYRLLQEDKKWAELKNQANEQGDEERILEYHLKGLEAGMRLAEFTSAYIRRYHQKKGIR